MDNDNHDDPESPPWVSNNELIGKPLARCTLLPSCVGSNGTFNHRFFYYSEDAYEISLFQPEVTSRRKPNLWRALIPKATTPSSGDTIEVLRAADTVPSQWKVPKGAEGQVPSTATPLVPTASAVAIVQQQLDTYVYSSVLRDWLSHLVVIAAIEECRTQFLQQCIVTVGRDVRHNGSKTGTTSDTNKKAPTISHGAPPYYRQSPSSYLTAPIRYGNNGSTTETADPGYATLPVQFSPSQLVQRIKQGCLLAWQDYERRIPVIEHIKSNSSSAAILSSDRRASSRLARQQQFDSDNTRTYNNEPRPEWKVIPGGQIALFLRERLLIEEKDEKMIDHSNSIDDKNLKNGADNQNTKVRGRIKNNSNNEVDSENGEIGSESDDRLYDDNPFLLDIRPAILEWLGRKTAKFLTSSDIQGTFPSLLPPQKTKSNKKSLQTVTPGMTDVGVNLFDYLSPIDFRIWKRMLADSFILEGTEAKLYLKNLNDEDTSKIQEWEPSSFGRSQFTIRVWNETAALKITEQALENYNIAEAEYKEKKSWGMWRHKGVTTGYTIWPPWLKTIEAWRKENSSNDVNSKPEGNSDTTDIDLELAKSLAEQDMATTNVASSRRSRRGGEGSTVGVFYGSQANLTHKQLMEALLRLISLNSYQTSSSLASTVLDSSADPHRRIRAALGKLLWKRNQITRLPPDPRWSDLPIYRGLIEKPLVTVEPEILQSLPVSVTSTEVEDLVDYLREMHLVELRLRQIVMQYLSEIPIDVIATSADEKPGSYESLDMIDFEEEGSKIQWHSSGHSFLEKLIFRPVSCDCSDEKTPCQWFKVKEFSDSVASVPEDGDGPIEKPQIGRAKESTIVKRRRRFRAFAASNSEKHKDPKKTALILTEAQVHAGLKAAELETKRTSLSRLSENPYSSSQIIPINLISSGNSPSITKYGFVVGHDCVIDPEGSIHQRVLVLLDKELPPTEAKWARLIFHDNEAIECSFEGESMIYTIQRFEFQSNSAAFHECRNIIEFLSRHPKSGPFLEPVDPIALGVPHYRTVIKHPMDISTLTQNLESGKYSNVIPVKSSWKSPTARMLNGPFRRDVELIFDNAMLFNPSDDWIHIAAASIKKAVCRKIDQISTAAEQSFGVSGTKHSIYVDDDSDFDYEESASDQEEYTVNRKNRKRKTSSIRPNVKEDASTRSIERPIRLQKILSDGMGVRGALANIPMNTDAASFSLPSGWSCRFSSSEKYNETQNEAENNDTELDELIALQKAMDDRDNASNRRSTRTYGDEQVPQNGSSTTASPRFEYYYTRGDTLAGMENPQSRLQIEQVRETLHEEYFGKLYQKLQKSLSILSDHSFGGFTEGSFPPYLGRVIPEFHDSIPHEKDEKPFKWEIRDEFLVPALRWIIRGLIQSEHLDAQEALDTISDNGSVLPNFIYYADPNLEPFDIIDVKELSKKKRQMNGADSESSDDDVELSAYEKMRADRVARNAERLKSLGLA